MSPLFITVAVCDDCWTAIEPNRTPVRLKDPAPEICYRCDRLTMSGIYVRTKKD